jgi:hypothetical protein
VNERIDAPVDQAEPEHVDEPEHVAVSEHAEEPAPVEPHETPSLHVDDAIVEPADTVHALPADKPEGASEPAANGTARVPER